jgi:hypothetical protein
LPERSFFTTLAAASPEGGGPLVTGNIFLVAHESRHAVSAREPPFILGFSRGGAAHPGNRLRRTTTDTCGGLVQAMCHGKTRVFTGRRRRTPAKSAQLISRMISN